VWILIRQKFDDILNNFHNKLISLDSFKFSVLVYIIKFLFEFNFLKLNSLVLHKIQFSNYNLNNFYNSMNNNKVSLKRMYNFLIIQKKLNNTIRI